MLDVHHRIFVYKKKHPRGDAIPFIAQQLAQEAQLLCFDEFQVTDIADAMILKRLFLLLLLEWKVVVVATSNRPPDGLYEGGLNRSLFLPFINVLNQTSDVVNIIRRRTIEKLACEEPLARYIPHIQTIIYYTNSTVDELYYTNSIVNQ